MKQFNLKYALAATILFATLSACGYKGALYLPEKLPEPSSKTTDAAVEKTADHAVKQP